MRVEIFVQARMGSTRLPGKVLLPVLEKPLLYYLVERLLRVKEAETCVIVTSYNPCDDVIEAYCKENKIACFRGPEEDVLTRYYEAAKKRNPDAIVRITADCPLIDPEGIDAVIASYKKSFPAIDYASNCLERTYPRGMDVEIFSLKALEKAFKEAISVEEREHVTLYLYRHPELFRLQNIKNSSDQSQFRLTVDTEEDYRLIRLLIEHLYPTNPQFTMHDILACLNNHPEWLAINAHIQQKPL